MLVRDFSLSVADALPLMLKWNERCRPPRDTAELKTKLEHARKYAKEPPALRLGKHIKGSGEQKDKVQDDWETPIPLVDSSRPPFPSPQRDDQFWGFWEYCARVSESVQTPVDLAFMLALATASAAISKTARVHIRGDYQEPLAPAVTRSC